jgi:hypothetical protein
MAVIMIIAVIVVMVIAVIVVMIIVTVIVGVDSAIKVLGFSPHQSRPDCRLDREGATIAKAPLEDTAKHAINGVMPGLFLDVVVETTMALDGEDWGEVEFTGFKSFTRSTMGAMGFGR